MLKFSNANVKLVRLYDIPSIKVYLEGRKIYSLDLLSGHSCPYAKECLSKVVSKDGTHRIQDGPHTKFRCYSASQEVIFPAVRRLRQHNFNMLRPLSYNDMVDLISKSMPSNLGVCRIHVGGDMFNDNYLRAWITVAQNNPDKLFYTYTKSLPFIIRNRNVIDDTPNFIYTASYGGRYDSYIDEYNLRYSGVVFSEGEAIELGLEIDHDDSHAADPIKRHNSFALLLHGIQPKASKASEAIKTMKKNNVKFSYSK